MGYTTYAVRRGDTLGRIARRFGKSVDELAALNRIADPDRITAGQVLRIEPAGRSGGNGRDAGLGALSRKYEVGDRGPGTVSGGQGDPGGVSYGSYQLASRLGNPQRFLETEGRRWLARFTGREQGTAAFSAAWKSVAAQEPEAFHLAQHAFIGRTHFEPQLARILLSCGIDLSRRSRALLNVVWSVAVQHGPASTLIGKALSGLNLAPAETSFDEAAIRAIYAERGRVRPDGSLAHFARSAPATQRAVATRFRHELADALAMLAQERSASYSAAQAIFRDGAQVHDRTKALMARGSEFLGSEWAILCGAMSWVSERNLVSAISNAGGFGVIACGAMTPELLDVEIAGTRALTAKPFGVNLITMHPQLFDLIEVCARHGVGHVVLAGGIPPKGSVEAIKAGAAGGAGAKVICFAPTLALGKKLLRSGADALVIEGMEAGGHIGPVSTSVLAQEILPALAGENLVFVAGGIGRGEAMAGYLEMGACGAQLGTRFACADESIAHPDFKKAFFRASARDAVTSVQVDPRLPVIPVRALKNKGTEEFTAKQIEVAKLLDEGKVDMGQAQLEIEHFWAGALRRAVIDGDVERGSIMAGQSVGMVTAQEPVAQIIASLLDECETALSRRGAIG